MVPMFQNNLEKDKKIDLTDEVSKFLQDSGEINPWR